MVMAHQSRWEELPSDIKDLFLSRLGLRDLVCWGSTCKPNAVDIDRAVARELKVTVTDVIGPDFLTAYKNRNRSVKSFFVEFLRKRASIVTRVDIDWVCWNTGMLVNAGLPLCTWEIWDCKCGDEACTERFSRRHRQEKMSPNTVCCGCKDRLCLAGPGDYAVLPHVTDLRLRTDNGTDSIPLWMFPNVERMHLEVHCIGREKLAEGPFVKLETVTLAGVLWGHLPTNLDALKDSPVLREVTLLRNVDGHGSRSAVGDLSSFRNAHTLKVGTNLALSLEAKLDVTEHTVGWWGDTIDEFKKDRYRVRRPVAPKIVLLLPRLGEQNAEMFAQVSVDAAKRGWSIETQE